MLDGSLRAKFRLAGARFVHLTDTQTTARAREHALQAGTDTHVANVEVVQAEFASGVSLVLAVLPTKHVGTLVSEHLAEQNAAVGLASCVSGECGVSWVFTARLFARNFRRMRWAALSSHPLSPRPQRKILRSPSHPWWRRGCIDEARRCSTGNGESYRYPDRHRYHRRTARRVSSGKHPESTRQRRRLCSATLPALAPASPQERWGSVSEQCVGGAGIQAGARGSALVLVLALVASGASIDSGIIAPHYWTRVRPFHEQAAQSASPLQQKPRSTRHEPVSTSPAVQTPWAVLREPNDLCTTKIQQEADKRTCKRHIPYLHPPACDPPHGRRTRGCDIDSRATGTEMLHRQRTSQAETPATMAEAETGR